MSLKELSEVNIYLFFANLLLLSIVDAKTMRLPDPLTFLLLILAVMFSPIEPDGRVAGMVGASGLLFALAESFRWYRGTDGLGFGDVKLAAGCGAWVGLANVGPLLLVSALLALLATLCATAAGAGARPDPSAGWALRRIAFGPYLGLGTASIAVLQSLQILG